MPYPWRTVFTFVFCLANISISLPSGAAPEINVCNELKSYLATNGDFARKIIIGGTKNALVILYVFSLNQEMNGTKLSKLLKKT